MLWKTGAPIALFLAGSALASESDLKPPSNTTLEVMLGVSYTNDGFFRGVLVKPKPDVVLDITCERGQLFAGISRGVGAYLVKTDQVKAGLAVAYLPGRKESQDGRYRGLGNVAGAPQATAFVDWSPVKDVVEFVATVGKATRSRGMLATFEATIGFPVAGPVNGFVDLVWKSADARYTRDYYGVDANQATASGYRVFTPAGGRLSTIAQAGIEYKLSPSTSLITSFGANRLEGDAGRSPILDKRTHPLVNLAVNIKL